jgi:hypothetical protein
MFNNLRARAFDREALSTRLTNVARLELKPIDFAQLQAMSIPSRGAIVGTWQADNHDPYPEMLIVRDEDYADTLAWLGAFFTGLAPITQWCRIWPRSAVDQLARHRAAPSVGNRLGPWVGLVIAEIAVESGRPAALKEVTGTAALTSMSFAAARGIAVWNGAVSLHDIAQRHSDLSNRLRPGRRSLSPASLLPLWYTLGGDPMWLGAESDQKSLAVFGSLLDQILANPAGEDILRDVVQEASDRFDLPLLIDCSRGPQLERVQALDRLATQLAFGPRSEAATAWLGFAASLIEPGVAVFPELLKKYADFPLAALWLGAFAGAWSPAKVLADHQGLGRLISKAILAELDLEGRPRCDIAYDELTRWLGGAQSPRVGLRGMTAWAANVEILPGVTCPFALDRVESATTETTSYPSSASGGSQQSRTSGGTASSHQSVISAAAAEDMMRRLSRLEESHRQLEERVGALASAPEDQRQNDLPLGIVDDVRDNPKPTKRRAPRKFAKPRQ